VADEDISNIISIDNYYMIELKTIVYELQLNYRIEIWNNKEKYLNLFKEKFEKRY